MTAVPATQRTVLLASAGCPGRRATRHVFVRREPVAPTRLAGAWSGREGIALIYRCEVTGVERRYGIE